MGISSVIFVSLTTIEEGVLLERLAVPPLRERLKSFDSIFTGE